MLILLLQSQTENAAKIKKAGLIDNMQDLLAATALLLVFEGIMPFVRPAMSRQMALLVAKMDDKSLRTGGFISMMAGLLILYFIK